MLPTQCKLIGIHVPSHLKAWANIKDVFRKYAPPVSHKRGGRSRPGMDMASMLIRLGLVLEGRHHSGLDDCRNIAKVARELVRLSGCAPLSFFQKRRRATIGILVYSIPLFGLTINGLD
ncbi:unnamed protein product [Laminaria digitata]